MLAFFCSNKDFSKAPLFTNGWRKVKCGVTMVTAAAVIPETCLLTPFQTTKKLSDSRPHRAALQSVFLNSQLLTQRRFVTGKGENEAVSHALKLRLMNF